MYFCIQVRFQPKLSMKRGFFEGLKAVFHFYYLVVELTGTSITLKGRIVYPPMRNKIIGEFL